LHTISIRRFIYEEKPGSIMVDVNQPINGITIDMESVSQFIRLTEKEELLEEDLEKFISTKGIQYLINQEKDGPNSSKDVVKNHIQMAKRASPEETGGWAAAWKKRADIKKKLNHIVEEWDHLVIYPLSIVSEYIPERCVEKGTFYMLPGGASKTYSDRNGFAVNLGLFEERDSLWVFLVAQQCCRFWLAALMGEERPLTACETPSEFIETLLSLTHRQGMAVYVGLKASKVEEQIFEPQFKDSNEIRTLYGRAFQIVLEGKAQSKLDEIQRIFSGHTPPSAVIGAAMAKAIDESGRNLGHSLGKEALRNSLVVMGSYFFFEIYKGCDRSPSLLPDSVWEAFEKMKNARGLRSVRDGYFLPSL
jgi:hypothetical protein